MSMGGEQGRRVMSAFNVGLLQMSCIANPAQNLAKAIEGIRELAKGGANVVGLQELFLTEYFCQQEDPGLFELAESIPGPTSDALGEVARELGVVVVTSIFERRAAGVYYNTGVVIDADGSIAGKYQKMHIPHTPLYREKYFFAPGESSRCAFQTRFGKIAVLVCWDQWFPEAARMAALQGAELIIYPTAIGFREGERMRMGDAKAEAWQTVQRGHAIANGCYIAAVNRVGHEGSPNGGITFWGRSFIADPFGRVLAQAGEGQERISAAVDPGDVERQRQFLPFLRDRRIDLYAPLAQRFG